MVPRKLSILLSAFGIIAVIATVVPLAITKPWQKKTPPPTDPNAANSNPQYSYLPNPYSQNSGSSNPQNAATTPQGTRGQMTYYAPGLGACGITSSANDNICAIGHALYDAHNLDGNPNHNPLCGHRIRATHAGKSLVLTVVDRCEACAAGDIDLSPGAFGQLEDLGMGRVPVVWTWLEPRPEGV
ncbi:hypothetical protein G7Y79_00046g082050 [Physcia stellaris]|nr:hypothetical protein G7Y79_00046g082050 [Physcia stellaris]